MSEREFNDLPSLAECTEELRIALDQSDAEKIAFWIAKIQNGVDRTVANEPGFGKIVDHEKLIQDTIIYCVRVLIKDHLVSDLISALDLAITVMQYIWRQKSCDSVDKKIALLAKALRKLDKLVDGRFSFTIQTLQPAMA